jgi:N-glycosidase YbiA
MSSIEETLNQINWSDTKHLLVEGIPLIPTIIRDVRRNAPDNVIGLAYSSKESLARAIEKKIGVYHSRKRGLWIKSDTSRKKYQQLVGISIDCDADTLIFDVVPRGPNCHTGTDSCFKQLMTFDQNCFKKIVFGYCTGNPEAPSLKLLQSIGVDIFKHSNDRSIETIVNTHLHPNVEVIAVKPKELNLLWEEADIVVAYDNLVQLPKLNEAEQKWDAIVPKSPVKPTKLVAVKRPGPLPFRNCRIFSEYPHLSVSFVQKIANGSNGVQTCNMTPCSGSAESYVKQNMADIGICITVSGSTIEANGLEIMEVICESDLKIYHKHSLLQTNPRLIRDIRNNLDTDTIYFYSVDGPEGFLSNFYTCEMVDESSKRAGASDGPTWKSSEHYYQAHKFSIEALFNLVADQKTCRECYSTAWKYKDQWVPNWTEVVETDEFPFEILYKDLIMYRALQCKFSIPELRERLLSTGNKRLVEHAMRDFHYGIGHDGTGKNMLGLLLMFLRDQLKVSASSTTLSSETSA